MKSRGCLFLSAFRIPRSALRSARLLPSAATVKACLAVRGACAKETRVMKMNCLVLAVLSLSPVLRAAEENGAQVSDQSAPAMKASPPKQPANGPGGSQYAHRSVRQTEHGEGGMQYWIIEPAQPAPKTAPLVIFLHGWTAVTPDTYRGWVNHLAKRGNIVVYPRYQSGLLTPAMEFFPNSIASIRAALEVLAQPGHVRPDLERIAVVGHSAGGVQTANYLIAAASEKLPAAKAAMIVEPGQGKDGGFKILALEDCKKIPADVKLIVMVGDADGLVGTGSARAIWRDTKQVRDRAFVTMCSDAHGMPALKADHLFPISWSRVATDALDWLGLWKTFDALMDSAFSGKPLTVDENLGVWSDGTAVTPMKVER